jgi:hypothetical protein
MPRAKSTRTNGKAKATSPENGAAAAMAEVPPVAELKKHASPIPINLEEEIRRRAYELYEQRGCKDGHQDDDWLVAEREVLARYQQQSA